MMKTLLIMRHAKSGWGDASLPDHDRSLNSRGKTDAPRMGQLIKEEGLTPDLIVSSTAKRAKRTAELVAQNCGYAGEIQLTRDIYHAGIDEYMEILQKSGVASTVMIVGHNPGMGEFVDYLTDRPEMMTTANIAVIQLPIDSWWDLDDETEGELVKVWRPKEL